MFILSMLAFAGTWGEIEPGSGKGWTRVDLEGFKDPGDIEITLANHDWAAACPALRNPAVSSGNFSFTVSGISTPSVEVWVRSGVILNEGDDPLTSDPVGTCIRNELDLLTMRFGDWEARPSYEHMSLIAFEYRLQADGGRPIQRVEPKHGLDEPVQSTTPSEDNSHER